MNSYSVARELAAFAGKHQFGYIQRTLSHWQIKSGGLLMNVYNGKKGLALYIDSSNPMSTLRTHDINVILTRMLYLVNTFVPVAQRATPSPVPAAPAPVFTQAVSIQHTAAPADSNGQASRVSAIRSYGGLKCRVTTTRPVRGGSSQPRMTSVVLMSEGDPPVGVALHDGDTDERIQVYDASDVTITVGAGEPTTALIRLLRFAAFTLEEMVDRNMTAAEGVRNG